MEKTPRPRDPDDPDSADPQEAEAARILGRYVDRFAAGEVSSLENFLAECPQVDPEVAGGLQALEKFAALVGEKRAPIGFGDFKIRGEAGRGAMGIVYDAWQVSLDRRVALKVLPAALMADPRMVSRFQREAKLAAGLNHPNIVRVLSAGVESGTPYIALEFADGETLQEILDRWKLEGSSPGSRILEPRLSSLLFDEVDTNSTTGEGLDDETTRTLRGSDLSRPLSGVGFGSGAILQRDRSEPRAAYYVRVALVFQGAADGLHHAHSLRVIHRDIKPSNLMLDPQGRLRILDFGLARMEGQERLTLIRERPGTPLYMSPEQVQTRPVPITHSTDIYSLGATLYEMLSGKPPVNGRSHEEIQHRIAHHDPVPLRRLDPTIPRDLESIVFKCLRKDPRERYGSAEALSQDLRRFARGDPVEARPQPWRERLARRAWRSRRKIGELAVVIALVSALGGIWWKNHEQADDESYRQYRGTVTQAGNQLWVNRVLSAIPPGPIEEGEPVLHQVPQVDPTRRTGRDGGYERRAESGQIIVEAGPSLADLGPDPLTDAVDQLRKTIVDSPNRPDAYYYLARGLLLQGRIEEANRALEKLLSIDRAFVGVLNLQVMIAATGGNGAGAAKQAVDSAAALPAGRWANNWVEAHRALDEGRWAEAIAKFGELIEVQASGAEFFAGSLAEARLLRGLALLRQGEYTGALADFYKAGGDQPVKLVPDLVLGAYRLRELRLHEADSAFKELYQQTSAPLKDDTARAIAITCRHVGHYKIGLDWVEKMKESPGQLILKAELHRHLKNGEAALAAASRAVGLANRDPLAYVALGNALMAMGNERQADALAAYRTGLNLDRPDSRHALLRVALGLCLEKQHDFSAAETMYKEAVQIDAKLVEARYHLSRLMARAGETAKAIRGYEELLVLEPRHASAWNNLGVLLGLQGKLEDAQEAYARAIEVNPALALAHFNLGWAYHRRQRFPDAARHYQEAIRLGMDDAVVHNNLAPCLFYMNDLPGAADECRRTIALKPSPDLLAQVSNTLGVTLEHSGDLAGARDAFRETLKIWTRFVDARNNLGNMLYKLGDDEEAVRQFERAIEERKDFVHSYNNLATLLLHRDWPLPEGEALSAAIRRLEDGEKLRWAAPAIGVLLERYRAALHPGMASYASIDAMLEAPETLVAGDASWRYFPGRTEPSEETHWAGFDFDDGEWKEAAGGFSSAASPREGIRTILTDMPGGYTSLYLRTTFTVPNPALLQHLYLSLVVQDGVVVYLNGMEAARLRTGEVGQVLTSRARADGEESKPWFPRRIELDRSSLREGKNLLAIQAVSANDGFPFTVAPVLLAVGSPGEERIAKGWEVMQSLLARGQLKEAVYLEGRLLEIQGMIPEAEASYREVLEQDDGQAEPYLRRAACLRMTGDFEDAEECLRTALAADLYGDQRLWEAWQRIAFAELGWSSKEMLERIPRDPDPKRDLFHDSGDDFLWILRALEESGRARINCGGKWSPGEDGIPWGPDRFYLGGDDARVYFESVGVSIRPGPIYQNERVWYLGHDGPVRFPAYAIPLPRGRYQVILHFVEGHLRAPDARVFDFFLEGRLKFPGYEAGRRGFGVPDAQLFEVTVDDGLLNLEFQTKSDVPRISGIEIVALK